MKIGFIGTGLMGFPMVERLLSAGHEVIVFNRTMEKALPLAEKGARVVNTAAEVFTQAPVVMLMLSDGKAVRSVLFQSQPPVPMQGKIVIQMSTIAPAESLHFAQKVEAAGGEYLEAPVLGSIPQVKAGQLIVMVGGSEAQFQKFKSIFQVFGPNPIFVGKVGKASALKLALNQLIASLGVAFALSLGMVMRSGIDVDVFMDVLRRSALYAPMFDNKLERMVKRHFDQPNFPLRLMLKDVLLIENLADSLHLNTTVVQQIRHVLEDGIKQGLAEKDYSAFMEVIVPQKENS